MTELMPCPFCGKEPRASWCRIGDMSPGAEWEIDLTGFVQCDTPGCAMSCGCGRDKWNTRPAPSPSDAACPHGCEDGEIEEQPHFDNAWGEHGLKRTPCPNPACHGKGAEVKKRPTVAELEAILNDPRPLRIVINPDGSISAKPVEAPSPSREGWTAPHMCRDGHQEIHHFDSENEQCPLCMALSALRPAGDEGLRVAVKEALDYMVDNGSYTQTREGRIALRDGYLAALHAEKKEGL